MNVILLSGGVDSAVLLANSARYKPHCVTFDYGQRHSKEIRFAEQLAAKYCATWQLVKIDPSVMNGSALTGGCDVPHAHYLDKVQSKTVVPNRNMVMLSMAASVAVGINAKTVSFAAHAGDYEIYPDCRPEFVKAMSEAMQFACGVSLYTPFIHMQKRSVVALGRSLGVNFNDTWTCYEGNDVPCGECGACVERIEAMK